MGYYASLCYLGIVVLIVVCIAWTAAEILYDIVKEYYL